MSSKVVFLQVILHTPHHSAMGKPLTYKSEQSLTPGTLVNVPLGKKEMLGVVWEVLGQAPIELKLESIQFIHYALVGIAPLSQEWMSLVSFTARYYQRSLGEVAIHALPAGFKNLDEAQLAKRLAKLAKQSQKEVPRSEAEPVLPKAQPFSIDSFQLATEQKQALEQIQTQPGPFLLFGVTGSGKTEVYLQADQVSLAIGRRGVNIKLASELTGYELDVYREDEEMVDEFDIDMDEFTDEIEPWIIDEFKRVGCDTGRSVLKLSADELERRTDLEKETIEEVRRILQEEFDKGE